MTYLHLPRFRPTIRLGFSRALAYCAAEAATNIIREAVGDKPLVLHTYFTQLENMEKEAKYALENMEKEAKYALQIREKELEVYQEKLQHAETKMKMYLKIAASSNYDVLLYRNKLHMRGIFEEYEAKYIHPLGVSLSATRAQKWRAYLSQHQYTAESRRLEAALGKHNPQGHETASIMVGLYKLLSSNIHRVFTQSLRRGELIQWTALELGPLNSAAMEWICKEYPIEYEVISTWPDIKLDEGREKEVLSETNVDSK